MKTFKELSIGDTIYRLCSKYELGKPDKQQVNKIIVQMISIDKTTGNLLINQTTTYTREQYWDIIVKAEKLNKSYYRFDPEQNTHRAGFYFLNADDANYIVRRAVVAKINEIEKSIPAYIARSKKEIEGLRSTFYEILNPSQHADFQIITQ